MTFEEYLAAKKIDSTAFKSAEPQRWKEWEGLFSQLSEQSFTAQKLYLINPTRRKYHLKESSVPKAEPTPAPAAKVKPVIKPKMS